ncbi:hypothetical protein [Fibrobacter sp. UWB3]|uniref:hypothetical protein n=1 Tax=Fibrobacter sp. UWB3 TaxID=1964357 RepID=UPI000B52027D|nr:hypothetical protein [Fibrobacter sp. UWB3]OWV19265.1 hypothetical protein B7991_08410 [Fibrobacter sp. UWB3]
MVKELRFHELCIKGSNGKSSAKTLFILESPFDSELLEDCACVGKTGKKMTKILGLQSDDALGKMLNDRNQMAKEYAVFNTFKFPLDVAVAVRMIKAGKKYDLWSKSKMPWCGLKNDEDKEIATLKREINTINSNRFCKSYYLEYKNSLMFFLQKSPNLRRIVVCGRIAQAMFESIIEGNPSFKYLKFKQKEIGDKVYEVMYTKHPSVWLSPDEGYGKKVKDALNCWP